MCVYMYRVELSTTFLNLYYCGDLVIHSDRRSKTKDYNTK